MWSMFSLPNLNAVLIMKNPITNPIIGSKIGKPKFDTIIPIKIATDEKISVFWCCPSAIIAGLLMSFPILIMYLLIT